MIQIYLYKRSCDVQKAERWFKERRIPTQTVDLSRARLGRRELEAMERALGLDALIDKESAAWKECPARFSADREAVLSALLDNPRRLRLPLVRNGQRVTVGYCPQDWASWQDA